MHPKLQRSGLSIQSSVGSALVSKAPEERHYCTRAPRTPPPSPTLAKRALTHERNAPICYLDRFNGERCVLNLEIYLPEIVRKAIQNAHLR